MKTLLALAAVSAALIFAVPANARPIVDVYSPPTTTTAPAQPAQPADSDHTVLWAAGAAAVAFLLGAAGARLVVPPRRRASAA
jgi:hypothetical protein